MPLLYISEVLQCIAICNNVEQKGEAACEFTNPEINVYTKSIHLPFVTLGKLNPLINSLNKRLTLVVGKNGYISL